MGPIRNSTILFRFGHEDKVTSNPLSAIVKLAGWDEGLSSNRYSVGGEGPYTHTRRAILLMAATANPEAWTFIDPNYAIERTSSIEISDDVLGPNVL